MSKTNAFVESHRVLLTQEEETKLFLDWRETPPGLRKDRLLNQIVLNFTPIIRKSMKKLSGYNMDPAELEAEGLLALVEAAHRFDLSQGFRFSTFAKSWVHGVMLGYITRNYFPINVCTSHEKKKLFFGIRREISEMLRENGSFELTQEIITKLSTQYGLPESEVAVFNNLFRRPSDSLNEPITGQDGDATRGDMIDSGEPNPEEQVLVKDIDQHQKRVIERAAQKVLDDREKLILQKQILTEESETLEQLGERLNISKERVRQVKNIAMAKISAEIRRSTRQEDLFA